jgi:Sec-independent protein secretion pathway component TatC
MDPPVKMIKKVMMISIILAIIGVSMAYTALY